ncbi:ATP-binding protein [Celerinatantimonas sp. YJH-8]|uniref:ATP-binding protein n=1 Tax=Celerinatantimonas sp. YJH-8 TaxID=3228714 RepID=UPI0038C850F6
MKNHPSKIYSIKRRLIISVVAVTTSLLMISLVFSYFEARHEIMEVYDARLGRSAKQLLLTLPDMTEEQRQKLQGRLNHWMDELTQQSRVSDDRLTGLGHPYELNLLVQFYRNGQLMWNSHYQIKPVLDHIHQSGFGYFKLNGERWRYFLYHAPLVTLAQNDTIIVAEKQEIRQDMMHKLAISTTLPMFLLIPLLALFFIVLINRYFRPISELQQRIGGLNINQLNEVTVRESTLELAPLVDTLNQLLNRLNEAWQRERRFTRMAAHELKTPLTILRVNAENALSSRTPEELQHDLQNILQGIERSDRLIQQLLMLAKVEGIRSVDYRSLDLQQVVQQVMAYLVPVALKNQQELVLQSESSRMEGDLTLLEVLFSNLIDNAIRYSGMGSEIRVDIRDIGAAYEVRVSDTGPAIPESVRLQIFNNFYRAQPSRGDGAGLGMSITRDIAKLHHGQVELLPFDIVQQNMFLVTLSKKST